MLLLLSLRSSSPYNSVGHVGNSQTIFRCGLFVKDVPRIEANDWNISAPLELLGL